MWRLTLELFRSQTLAPGKTALARIDCDIKLSLVVLDEKLANEERSSIKIIQHDPEDDETTTFVLANLIPGKVSRKCMHANVLETRIPSIWSILKLPHLTD